MEAESPVELSPVGFNFPDTARTGVGRSAEPQWAPAGAAALIKRFVDVIGAILLGMVFLPLIVVIFFMLRKGGGPVIYVHRRVGRGGQMFPCFKFRTMVPNADHVLRGLLESSPELQAEWVRDHKLRHDPRV